MKLNTYKCDVCQKLKGEVNHWWIISQGQNERGGTFIVEPWAYATPEAIEQADYHVCGQEHLMKILADWCATR